MAKLYGKISADDSQVTRTSQHSIATWVQTAKGRVKLFLSADGEFYVELMPSTLQNAGESEIIVDGNINTRTWKPMNLRELLKQLTWEQRHGLLRMIEELILEDEGAAGGSHGDE